MKLFKTVDEKFAEIGFVKVEENKYGVTYKRKVDYANQKIKSKYCPNCGAVMDLNGE